MNRIVVSPVGCRFEALPASFARRTMRREID